MNRALKVFGIFAFIAIMVFALRAARPRPGRGADWASIKTTLDSAITNPIAFGKTHFTGGIGIMVGTDPAAGLPLIAGVAGGSPAEKAGLRVGDIIIKVNDVATSGQSQAKILESIRGYAVGSVTVTVQRNGSTNLQCVIHRSSWEKLRKLSYNPYD